MLALLALAAMNLTASPRQLVDLNRDWEFVRVPGPTEAQATPDSPTAPRTSWESQYDIAYVKEGDDRFDLHGDRLELVKKAELAIIGQSPWESAVLPHTAHVEPLGVRRPWQGVCYYRRRLAAPKSWKGRSVVLTFDGAMQISDVWLNGRRVGGRRGGYLPVVIELGPDLDYGSDNELLVRLDNRDNPLVPPGRPTPNLDFLYWSGLYRDAYLTVTGAVHVTDPVLADSVRSGGVYFVCRDLTSNRAKALAQVQVANDSPRKANVSVTNRLLDATGAEVASAVSTGVAEAGSTLTPAGDLEIPDPHSWSPDSPYLYTLETSVSVGGRETDRTQIRVGLKKVEFSRERGFILNGKQVRLIGTNRHQEYPYLGNAISDDAGYRDMAKIKAAGFNCVRLSHYPMSPAVMDACDELGLLTIPCIPGWQFYNSDPRFEQRVEQDIRDLIRRDRNHACVMAWETSLNETYPPAEIARKWIDVAHQEFLAKDMTAVGDGANGAQWDWVYNGWVEDTKARPQDERPEVPGYIREYGDYEFGGSESTTRQPRSAGEKGELQSAWNFVWSDNRNRSQWPWTIGDGTWVMYDYHRGCDTLIEYSGMADVFRIPRFIYRFFQSQTSAKPMVFAATYWTERQSPSKVVVFSNCDEVELWLNGRKVAAKGPDDGPDTLYGDYMRGGNPWDGGNCKHLAHAPFTFTAVPFEKGELRAVGLRGGKKVAEDVVRTPGSPTALRLKANLCGRPLRADGADAVFVYAEVVDPAGTVVWDSSVPVKFTVTGAGSIVGPTEIHAEAGIATVLVRGGLRPGAVRIQASAGNLKGELTLRAR
jgi:beta-galactosidase